MKLYRRNGSAVYYYDFSYHGKRFRDSTEQTKENLAWIVANDAFNKVREQGVEALLRVAPLLENFAVEFLQWVEETQSFGKHAKLLYPRGWRLLKDTPLAKMRMDKISNHHCETIRFPGTTNANANTALRTLRRMFSKAKEMKRLYGDLPHIALRPEWPRSIEMSEDDARLIYSKWNGSDDSRDAFRTIRSTGMRPSEVFRMQWEYVKWDQGVYGNPNGKTKTSRRDVPLIFPPFRCMEILKDRHVRMGCPREGWIFPSATAECGHLTTINKPFCEARDLAGLSKKMVLYTARHGHATKLQKHATLKETMLIEGHSDPKVALDYQHPDFKGIAERLWAETNAALEGRKVQ